MNPYQHQHNHQYQYQYGQPCWPQQQAMPMMVPQPQFVDLNAELIRERETLRQQYTQLEEKYMIDIEELKVNLLMESEHILQKELTSQAKHYEEQLRQRDNQIQIFQNQIQQLERVNVEVKRENFEAKTKMERKKEKIQELKGEIVEVTQTMDKRVNDTEQYWRAKLPQEIHRVEEDFKVRIEQEKIPLDDQIKRLKTLCAQFEDKYKEMLKELERYKELLSQKQREVDELRSRTTQTQQRVETYQPQQQTSVQTVQPVRREYKPDFSPQQTRHLEQKIEDLQRELRKRDEKLQKKKTKIQTQIVQAPPQQIIIEKPVERIVEVEKIVPVIQEKIVCQPARPQQPVVVQYAQAQQNDEEIEELEEQIAVYRRQMNELQNQFNQLKSEYEYVCDDRDELKRNLDIMIARVKQMEDMIRDKNRELYDRVQNLRQGPSNRDDKVVVYVGKDKGQVARR